ncbi:hypothetical protein, variant 1 [Phytophthora nicotianae P10297]|uniref:Uncharacterized protein n=1 Tax=Phytophthora nicotianae P10297 TaxID=1317064 RepID=W2YSY5_PHYNI|nr:hypothetical protein F442_14900 [Phytophthora nicotianae P10297]ETP37284.1 hypothetical protein, variant 1 [Phytophthora nicotianae P10297]
MANNIQVSVNTKRPCNVDLSHTEQKSFRQRRNPQILHLSALLDTTVTALICLSKEASMSRSFSSSSAAAAATESVRGGIERSREAKFPSPLFFLRLLPRTMSAESFLR